MLLILSISAFAQGTVRLFQKDMKYDSSIHSRDVYIYLPSGYEKSNKRYPVIYMQDGQNLFDPARANQGQTWKVKETLDVLIKNKNIGPVIIVAIDNTPDRLNEYTPEGSGKAYLDFLASKLKPLVDKSFRTRSERSSTAIMGSSLGGLISLQAGMSHFQTFGLIGALSPSIWYNKRSMIRAYSMTEFLPQRVYLDSGTVGGEKPQDVWDLMDTLSARNFRLGDDLFVVVQEGANHSEKYWAERFPRAITFLFETNNL